MEIYKKYIKESSLSRLWRHNEKYDCGALTAFRVAENCGEGRPYTKKENKQRNKSLLAKLKTKGYSVTSLKGTYPEGGKTGKEESFFVVDIKYTNTLLNNLKSLGEEFQQDSILFVPKGSVNGEAKAILVGTNRCSNNFLGYHQEMSFEKGKFGMKSPIYTSFVNGRPFIFEDIGQHICGPNTGFGWWSVQIIAEKYWKDIEV